MKKYLIVLSTLVLFAFCSCTKIMLSGNEISKEFNIDGSYTELVVENAFEVTVSDEVTQIIVTTDENIMPKVVVEKDGDKLKIHLKPFVVDVGTDMKVVLPFNPDLRDVELSGASEFHSIYSLEGRKVEVELSGASSFYCDVIANEADIHLSGASDFHGEVQADNIGIGLSGASEFYGNIVADNIDVELSGGSNIDGDVVATKLDLNLSGASDATLLGQVSTLEIELEGASNIVKQVVGDSYGLACENCSGVMSGASEAYIHCDGRICVDLSGASNLHYTGNGNPSGCSTTSGGSSIIGPEHP